MGNLVFVVLGLNFRDLVALGLGLILLCFMRGFVWF